MRDVLKRLEEPVPFRFLLLRWLDRRLDFLEYDKKLNYEVLDRSYIGYCLLQAAMLAKKLGHTRIAAIEFGVAAGDGLLSLERHAERVREETGVETSIYGFDTGNGMPPPTDHRDLPYLWREGHFAMDPEELRSRLTTAKLVLGAVQETVERFCHEEDPPPIGFISFDLDYYSSTVAALRIFDADTRYFLPRVVCYLDDTVGDIDWAYNQFTGELLAVDEFNAAREDIKIVPVRGLRYFGAKIPRVWHEQVFVAHLFRHPAYSRPIGNRSEQPRPARYRASSAW